MSEMKKFLNLNNEYISEIQKAQNDYYLIKLRDEFAAKAMQSALIDWSTPSIDENFKMVAEFSYKMADAMLEARKS